METEWKYSGDVNLSYGGFFCRHNLNEYGFPYYTEVVGITDLSSATGADGLILVQFKSVFGYDDKEKVKESLACLGENLEHLRKKGKEYILDELCYAFLSYGYYDMSPDYYTHNGSFVLVHEYDQFSSKKSWDGWKPNIDFTRELHHNYDNDLEKYIKEVWLS